MTDFWDGVRRSALSVQNGPAWMRAGISLNPEHYNVFGAKTHMTDPHLMAQIPVPPAAKRPDGLTVKLSLGRIAVRAEAWAAERRLDGRKLTPRETLLLEAVDEHEAIKRETKDAP